MQQNSDLLKEKPQIASQVSTLLSLDIKTDSLKTFLENLVNVVNQQSIWINTLQTEIKLKAETQQVGKCFTRISESIGLHNNEFLKQVNPFLEKPKPDNTGDYIEDQANKVCNKVSLLGHASHFLYKGNQDWDKKLQLLEAEVNKKSSKDEMKAKVKKTKKKLLNEIEELRKKLQKQQDDLNRKVTGEINKFEGSIKETEKKTLWKIQDCEALLQKRVTGELVDSTCKALEDKLMKEMQKQKQESFGGILKSIEDLQEKVLSVDNNHQEKNKALKKSLKEMEDLFLSKLCTLEKFEINRKNVQEKLQEVENKLSVLDKRGDANQILEQAKQNIKELEAKLYELDRQGKETQVKVEELEIKVKMGDNGQKKGGDEFNLADPHKICQLEADIKRLRDDLNEYKTLYKTLDGDIKRKFDSFEHKVLSNFALLKNQEQNSMSKEDIIVLVERGKIQSEEKFKQMQKELDECKRNLGNISDLEKKIKKKFRDITENADFSKQMADKADAEETRREFKLMDEKVHNLNDLIQQFRREFESIEEFYSQLSMLLKTNQQETISVIAGNNRIIPNRCLACGTKGKQVHNSTDCKGSDGRIYKADYNSMKGTNVYEQQEVYDLLPNQISFSEDQNKSKMQFQSPTMNKQQIVSFKDRPTSAKTDIVDAPVQIQHNDKDKRPTSAKKM